MARGTGAIDGPFMPTTYEGAATGTVVGTDAPATPTTASTAAQQSSGLVADLIAQFPWLRTIGLDPTWLQTTAAESVNDSDVVSKLRQTQQYKSRFQGILRDDGSMRMSEAEYLSTESNYKQLLQQYGVSADKMDNPADFVGFFNSDIDANELKQRLDTWRQVQTGGQNMKDTFFVYAGMRVSDEELYASMVDPAAKQRLDDEYNQKVAAQPLDYETWITRATQAGLSRVSTALGQLQQSGALTGDAVQSVLRVDPNFARSIMDALYHGGDPLSGDYLNLQDLLATFEEASLGAAARQVGLALPSKERIQELRNAGVSRAQAQQTYADYAQNGSQYNAEVQRLSQGARGFGQSDFEAAALLGQGDQAQTLMKAQAQEKAYGQAAGQFQFGQNKRGQYTQQGLSTPY